MQYSVWVVGLGLTQQGFHPARNIKLLGALPLEVTELLS